MVLNDIFLMQMANQMCETPVRESKNLPDFPGTKIKQNNPRRRCAEVDLGSRLEKGNQNPSDRMVIGPGGAESRLHVLIWHAQTLQVASTSWNWRWVMSRLQAEAAFRNGPLRPAWPHPDDA